MRQYVVILDAPTGGEQEMTAAALMDVYRTVRSICHHFGTTDPYFGPQDATSRSFLWVVQVFGDDDKHKRFVESLENAVSSMPPWSLEVCVVTSEEGSKALKFPVPKSEQKPDGVVFVPAETLGQSLESKTEFSSCQLCHQEIARDGDNLWYHTAVNADHGAMPYVSEN